MSLAAVRFRNQEPSRPLGSVVVDSLSIQFGAGGGGACVCSLFGSGVFSVLYDWRYLAREEAV